MERPARATTSYGDLSGTIMVDGFDGFAATTLLSWAKGLQGPPGKWWPVGLEFTLLGDRLEQNGERITQHGQYFALLVASEADIGGIGPDAVLAYAKTHDTIPVTRCPVEIDFDDLVLLLKELSIVVQDRTTGGKELLVVGETRQRQVEDEDDEDGEDE